ncbi:DUF4625 domain-containing protein [Pedobacter aquatilis]|uniref:DUF4625 domain-containing protein n=1 Tax=Pedobacter aquatilis TaxID=351343 RepID=UPI0025B3397F|nr:DUF4625 domain-containing protein [Pedobacter aquatilis]MDN3588830.1 DUF4625 domain-containing protein [Pedobacter aquatilis]
MKTKKILITILLTTSIMSACKKDNQDDKIATIENLEIGLNNNEIGILGKDFHFNADVLAGDKLETIEVKILPKGSETYLKPWKYEVVWDQYKGAKNASVHKHFSIPNDAVEGKYDFVIIVNEQDGKRFELKKSITIYSEANAPVNPTASIFNVFSNNARFYRTGAFIVNGSKLKKDDLIHAQVTISNVKGDGKMYILFINKKHNHRPESIDKIDFTKAIVYDVVEHKGWTKTDFFSNSTFDAVTNITTRNWPNMIVGGTQDNNFPTPNAISGAKIWESGTYYFGVVYKNSTYNISFYQYIEIPVEIN